MVKEAVVGGIGAEGQKAGKPCPIPMMSMVEGSGDGKATEVRHVGKGGDQDVRNGG